MPHTSFIHAHASHADWRFALAACRRQLEIGIRDIAAAGTVEYTLGWCYVTDYYATDAEAILAQLQADFPGVTWTGTVGIGVAASGVEYIDRPAMALMLAPLPTGSFRAFSGLQPLPGPDDAFQPYTALVHGEAATPDIQELLEELADRTTTGYLFGGLASSRSRSFHMADGIFTGGLSGVLFGEAIPVVSRVTQGCQPVGPVRTITHAEDNYVISLDGRPALDCVLYDLGLAPDTPDDMLADALAHTLVGLNRGGDDGLRQPWQFGADTLVRHLVGVDPEHRVLAVADEVSQGMRLALCARSAPAARSDLVRIASEIRCQVERDPATRLAGALYISCSGRGGSHFGAPDAELQAVESVLGDVPLVGFFADGEIARNHLYGYTGVLTAFISPFKA